MNQYWENKLKEEAYTKSTLKYLNIDNMCNSGDEDRKHFIVICSKLMEVRQKFIIALKNILYSSIHHNLYDTIFSDTNTLTQLILDCMVLVYIPHSLHIPIENSRGLLYALHAARYSFLKMNG